MKQEWFREGKEYNSIKKQSQIEMNDRKNFIQVKNFVKGQNLIDNI